jgi:hypothetical protein
MDIRTICYVVTLLLASHQVLAGEIKRWVDQDGGVHFGQTAPHDIDATTATPVITTTEPATHNSLRDVLRPGERRMLRMYEQRGLRLKRGKRRSLKQDRQRKRQLARMEDRCYYHKQKKDELERKLRSGYRPAKKASISSSIDKHRLSIKRYCNLR